MAQMSFREKSAWISFISIALVFGIYFVRIHLFPGGWLRGKPVQLFLVLVAALVALEVALHVAIATQSPREARTPKDERERLIDLKATRLAFPVLLVGAFSTIGSLHLNFDRVDMARVMLSAIVAAELTRFAAQIVYHRRGF
jgi:hypothetical protein